MRKRYVFALMGVALLVLIIPVVFRALSGNSSLIGQESYFHLGLAQNINTPNTFPLPQVLPNSFHYGLAALLLVFHPSLIAKMLPILLGVFNVTLLYIVLRRLTVEINTAGIASVLLCISSLFIALHSTLQPFSLLLFLGLLSALVFTYSPRWSIPVLLASLSVDIIGFIVLSIALFMLALTRHQSKIIVYTFIAGTVFASIVWLLFGYLALNQFFTSNSLASFLTTFGSGFGFSSFIIILSVIGLIATWPNENRSIVAILFGIALFGFSFFEPVARGIILPFLVFLSAKGVLYIIQRRWSVASLRMLTLFLIGLTILFSTVMTINGLIHAEPSLTKIQAMNFLKTSESNDLTLSSVHNGIYIQRIAGRKAFLDPITAHNESLMTASSIFQSVRVKDAETLLKKYNITHILIDKEMRDGGVWTAEEQGLLFMAENSDRFVQVFDKGDVTIYRFVD